MKNLICLLVVLAFALPLQAFDAVYKPGQHAAIIALQCDDRVDTQFVNIAKQFNVSINFAPYKNGGGQIDDINDDYADGAYSDAMIPWAARRGMTFATHSQGQSPTAYNFGGDSLLAVWDEQQTWLSAQIALSGMPQALICHVWTGHANSPRVRALAKAYGYKYTRGALGNSRDLYLSANGWVNNAGAEDFLPPSMLHRALVPSFSSYRFTRNMSADSLLKLSTVADTIGLWDGVKSALTTAAQHNAFLIWNIHPGWTATSVRGETIADSLETAEGLVWLDIPDKYNGGSDSLVWNTRRGDTDRNDVSAYQLSYMMKAVQYWHDSTLAVDGVSRLCFTDINEFMQNPIANFRDDNSSDTSAVSDYWVGGSGLDEPYWTSNTGLYARDPELDLTRKVYIDGTGDVKAGNGTAEYPLPKTAWDHLFNCEVQFVNASSDTLEFTSGMQWRTGNVDIDFGGLTLRQSTASSIGLYIGDYSGSNYYPRNVTLRNATFDGDADGGTNALLYIGDGSSARADSIRSVDVTLKGMTFINREVSMTIGNSVDVVIDSCFFDPEQGALAADNAGNSCIKTATGRTSNALIRNSHFNIGASGSHSAAVYAEGDPEDSLRFLNSIVVTGNSGDDDDPLYVIRTSGDSTGTYARAIRVSGVYFDRNASSPADTVFWRSDDGGQALGFQSFSDWVTRGSATYTPANVFITGGYGHGVFNYATDLSDTLKYGGYTGSGRKDTGTHASIGPVLYDNGATLDPIGNKVPYTDPVRALELLRVMRLTGQEVGMRVNSDATAASLEIWLHGEHSNGSGTWDAQAADTLRIRKAVP